jgi:dihydroxyacetone kinase
VAEEKMGGTSGALYSIFFSALAKALGGVGHGGTTTQEVWAAAMGTALDTLYNYTRARPPSRTLVDPLAAFVEALQQPAASLEQAVRRAADAAEHTKELEAKAGRSAYVEGDRLRDQAVPDPGAWGVKVILEAISA